MNYTTINERLDRLLSKMVPHKKYETKWQAETYTVTMQTVRGWQTNLKKPEYKAGYWKYVMTCSNQVWKQALREVRHI